jgi:glycosyltransferase involved in cell wall biosynthesis
LRGRRFFLFLSRIHPKKGCDLLIQAFADSLAKLPDDLDLVIAGPDQVNWVPGLREQCAKLGITERVHWPGMLTGDVKWGAFHRSEALILSSHQENFGFVVAEAMACSTPVLISNKVNIWREVIAADAGLVAPDTLDGTRELIQRFEALASPERERMSRNARAGFEQYFDVRVTAQDFARVVSSDRCEI